MVSYKLLYRKYERYLINSKIKVTPSLWVTLSFILGIVGLVLVYLLSDSLVLGVIALLGIMDIVIGLPIYIEESRVSEIERHLPNALREMADILKSGGTYEYALREMSSLDFGALNPELEKVLIRLEEGSNFEEAMSVFGADMDSDLVKKIVSIIIDSVRAGAGLADILEDIAEDARKIYKLEQDRKAKTTMQVLFISASGGVIAPGIFGLVTTIVTFLIEVSSQTGVAGAKAILEANDALGTIQNSLMIYVFFESVASSFMIAMMRDKNVSRAILYLPIFLMVAYTAYFVVKYFAKSLLTGMI